MSSTSLMDLPLNRTSNVSRLYRLPLQVSHGTYTSGKNSISIRRSPAPSHVSHRPPFTLKENLPVLYPRIFASGICANKSRMSVNAPVYVAGFDRGVLPMGD